MVGQVAKTMVKKINIDQKLSLFNDHWNPRIIGELNKQHVKLAKIKGEFIWHKHDKEDEMFLVLKGILKIEFRDRIEIIHENETFYLKLLNIIDFKVESIRLKKNLSKVSSEIEKIRIKLESKNLIENAPEDIIKEQKDKADYIEIEELNSKVRKELSNKKVD